VNPFNVLVVDDEPFMRNAILDTQRERGFELEGAASPAEALERLARESFAAVVTDYRMPGMNGLEFLRRGKELDPSIDVALITGFGTVENAVEAMKLGAVDFLQKPIDPDRMEAVLRRMRERHELMRENRELKAELRRRRALGRIVGKSEPMQRICDLIGRIAASPATVLVTGESGTGKELVAGAIHEGGPRRTKPLVKINCAAMPDTLLESELFGHEKGAFTGAISKKAGHFEAADGGTLFLDEVGDIPLATQVKLLRAIQEKSFTRVGGTEPVKVDVRIIAATNADLEAAVREKRFREDLFFRLNVIPIRIPPLRERREDIPLLAEHFLARFAKENDRLFRGFDREAMRLLVDYPFPGNVRELMNLVERTVVLNNDGERVTADMLPAEVRLGHAAPNAAPGAFGPDAPLRDVEAAHIRRALDHFQWNIAETAKRLGIDRKTLYAKIERYALRREGAEAEAAGGGSEGAGA